MLKKEQLEAMKVDELRKLFKEEGVSYYKNGKRMTKIEMIDKYLELYKSINDEDVSVSTEEKKKKKYYKTMTPEEMAKKIEIRKKYVENAKVGEIVAFRFPSGKVISAAITKKSTKGRKFLVETKYGAEHKISFDDVIWVRTNKRWPKSVYLLFDNSKKVKVLKDGENVD